MKFQIENKLCLLFINFLFWKVSDFIEMALEVLHIMFWFVVLVNISADGIWYPCFLYKYAIFFELPRSRRGLSIREHVENSSQQQQPKLSGE